LLLVYPSVHVFQQRVTVNEERDHARAGSELWTQNKYCITVEHGDTSDTLFTEPRVLQMQKWVHSIGNCNVCKDVFSQQKSLSNHLHVHRQPYRCHACKKSCNQKSEHRIHMHLHTGEHPYRCDVCKNSLIDRVISKYICEYIAENAHIPVICVKYLSVGSLKSWFICVHIVENFHMLAVCVRNPLVISII
jgi:hypothetical protein